MEMSYNAPEQMHSDSIGKLAMALSKAQGQMDGANKSADNPFFKSKYADLNECIQAAKKPLADNELAVIQTTELCNDKSLVIVTTLAHSSGEWIKGKISMTPKKDDDQGRGSSITYGRRYSFAAIVGLAQKDDDGNASSGSVKGKNKERKPQIPNTIALWKKAIDDAIESGKVSTSTTMASWRSSNGSSIVASCPKEDQSEFKTYLDGLSKDFERRDSNE